MRKEGAIKEFWRTTYQSGSPIPYIVSIQVVLFIIIHLFDLLHEINVISIPLYDQSIRQLSLPGQFQQFIQQPWSLLTYPFLYTGLLRIIFDSLWLYWIGTMFLNFLNKRQFLTVFISSFLLGAVAYLLFGQIEFLYRSPQTSLSTGAIGIAAVMVSLIMLVPQIEARLFIIGTVKVRTIVLIYLLLHFGFYVMANKAAAATYIIAICWGWFFMYMLKNGNDISKIFQKTPKRTLKVVHNVKQSLTYKSYKADMVNQEAIDEILDKISEHGYNSLSTQEKEILFKASKENK